MTMHTFVFKYFWVTHVVDFLLKGEKIVFVRFDLFYCGGLFSFESSFFWEWCATIVETFLILNNTERNVNKIEVTTTVHVPDFYVSM